MGTTVRSTKCGFRVILMSLCSPPVVSFSSLSVFLRAAPCETCYPAMRTMSWLSTVFGSSDDVTSFTFASRQAARALCRWATS